MDMQKDLTSASGNYKSMNVFDQMVTRKELADYRLAMLNRQLTHAVKNSRFYRARFSGVKLPFHEESALLNLPFTMPQDIIEHGADMVCGSGGSVKRIVTLHSTGTDGLPKRLYFSEGDLKRTVDFFAVGMRYLCGPGDRAFLCMPAASENGIGQLLAEGLATMGAIPYSYGFISDYQAAALSLREARPHTVVGIPAQIRKLALLTPDVRPVNVLLSADYIAQSAKETISRIWDCEIFTHFGMTETGYGCAVECPAHTGQHIRHDELMLEIITPDGTEPMPDGHWGEIVLTTLRRESMPLIRYRTGDMGRLLRDKCACGSVLERLDEVPGRLAELSRRITIYRMDELLLAKDDVLDYYALLNGKELEVTIEASNYASPVTSGICREILAEEWPEQKIMVNMSETKSSATEAVRPAAKRGFRRV